MCVLRSFIFFFYFLTHINIVCITGSGAVALAHFDGTGIDEAVCTMVARVQELALGYPEGRIELQLIGGYRDPQSYGEEVFFSIMRKYLYSYILHVYSYKYTSFHFSSLPDPFRIIPQTSS